MPFISDIVGQEVNAVKNTALGTVNSVKNAGQILQNSVTNQVLGTVNTVAGKGVAALAGAAVSGLSNLATGNIQGALDAINPSNILNQTLGGLIGGGSSLSLQDPGYAFTASSSGGVNPGDALNGALARADPMLTFLWYAQVPVLGAPAGSSGGGVNSASNALNSLVSSVLGTPPLSSSGGGAQVGASQSQLPWYYVEEASCPFRNFQPISVFRDGRKRHYPGQYDVGALTLSFYMDVDNTAMSYLQAWNNNILQPYTASTLNTAGGFGRAAGYKYPIYIYLIDVTKSTLFTLEYTECWPTNVQDFAMTSQSGNERLIAHVPFSVGDVFVNMSNIPNSLTSLLVNNALTNTAVSAINQGFSTAAQSVINFL